MSKSMPRMVDIPQDIKEYGYEAFQSKVVKSGNGAVIRAFKRYIGKECLVIILEDTRLAHVFTDKIIKRNGNEYYLAIVNNAAGEHKIYIPREDIKKILRREN